MSDMVEVLSNGRFFLFVFGLLTVLVMGSVHLGCFTWTHILIFIAVWVAATVVARHGHSHKQVQEWLLVSAADEAGRLEIPDFSS